MTTAFVFPGQGSQYVGMGRDLYEAFPAARARFDEADRILGFPLTEACFGGGANAEAATRALTQTDVCQPALFTHSMAIMAALAQEPDMVAGHSVGEFSALAACGAISFASGLRLVRLRGRLMARAGAGRPGSMAAVLGMDDAEVSRVCEEASTEYSLAVPANFNAPGQIVIAGDVAALQRAAALAKESGARRVVPLPVSGAFHSPLMDDARAEFAGALATLDIHAPACPVYLNVTARATTSPREILDGMLQQLTSPVLWARTLREMHSDGAIRFLEAGAGRVLTGLARRTLGGALAAATVGLAAEVAALQESPTDR